MQHNLEYWDDNLWEKVLLWKIYEEVAEEFESKRARVNTSDEAEESHKRNGLHKYGSLMKSLIKGENYSAMGARDAARFFDNHGFLPVNIKY